jgi:four helix bundle protein
MNQQIDITNRTFNFAVRIVNLCKILDEKPGVGRVLYKQLIRSGTSIGANVEESQSAQSKADFVHKLEISRKSCQRNKILAENSDKYTNHRTIQIIILAN